MTLWKEELDKLCPLLGTEDQFALHGRCHKNAALWCVYDKPSGTLRLSCAQCHRYVTNILVGIARPSEGAGTAPLPGLRTDL